MGLSEFLESNDITPTENKDIAAISNRIEYLEDALKAYKDLEKELKDTKEQLKEAMIKNEVDSWKTNRGTKFTLVADTPETEVEVEYFDEINFRIENPGLYQKYLKTHVERTGGKKGYVRVTLPKERDVDR